ncbi:MAG: TIM barrel protein [Caldilineaceae bacterium]
MPDDFDRERAWAQLVDFGRLIGPLAVDHGVTIAVEPLNYAECNVLNTVAESAAYARDVDHPGVRLLVDAYHRARNEEPTDAIVAAGRCWSTPTSPPTPTASRRARNRVTLRPSSARCVTDYAGALSVEARGDVDLAWAQATHGALQELLAAPAA